MNKKKYVSSITLLLCSIIIFVVINNFFDDDKYFNNLIVNDKKYSSLKNSLKNSQLEGFFIKFEGYNLFFDKDDDRFYYSLIDGNKYRYNPKVSVSNGYKIAFNMQPITNKIISNNESINFIIYNNDVYHEYSLSCTTLPLMNIDYGGEEFFYDDQAMIMRLFDNQKDIYIREIVSIGKFRLRGISTAGFPKQGIRITLLEDDWETEKDENLLGLRRDGDWILYAGYNDVDKVRNVFCANLWKESCATNNYVNANTGTEYKYLELFINEKYYGLYALCYPIDAKQLKLKQTDYLYQPYMNQFENEISYEKYEEVKNNMRVKYGKENWNDLINYYENLFNYYRDNDSESIMNSIDINNAVDEYIFMNFIQGIENACGPKIRNIKICLINIKGIYKCIYIPWDFDIDLGNKFEENSKNSTLSYAMDYSVNITHTTSPVYMLIDIGDNDIYNRVINRYKELRRKEWSNESISTIIDEYEKEIYSSGAYFRDMKRWADGSYAEDGYSLVKFKKFVLDRLEYLDNYYK